MICADQNGSVLRWWILRGGSGFVQKMVSVHSSGLDVRLPQLVDLDSPCFERRVQNLRHVCQNP